MKTLITIDKFAARTGSRNLHKVFPSRSFTRGFIEQLYVGLAGILVATRYTGGKDLDGVQADMMNGPSLLSYYFYQSSHFRVSSGGGDSGMYQVGEDSNQKLYPPFSVCPSQDLGIMIGNDNTAATSADRRLVKRIGHGVRAAEGAAVLKSSYAVGENTDADINAATKRYAQPFTPSHDYLLTAVKLKLWRTGACGVSTVRIRGGYYVNYTTATIPSGTYCPDLGTATAAEAAVDAASPGSLVTFTFGTPIHLLAGHQYWICLESASAAGAIHLYWRYDTENVDTFMEGLNYYNGSLIDTCIAQSNDSGATYSLVDATGDDCFMFETWGQSIGDMEYDGCTFSGLVFADPNGSFNMRRRFHNLSGGSIDVNEVGIGAGAGYLPYQWSSHLIARDVTPGAIAVADGEILEVTYTPSITV
jgi:hypothetical protein